MAAGKYNLVIEQGADFERVLTWKARQDPADDQSPLQPVDLTGMSATLEIRTAGDRRLVASLYDGNGISFGDAPGTIIISLTAEQTGKMSFTAAQYNLELTDSLGKVRRLIKGQVILDREP